MTLLNHNTLSRQRTDKLLFWTLRIAAFFTASIVLLILFFLMYESFPAVKKIGITALFTDESWHPLSGLYNMLPMAVASLLACCGATILAFIPGLASAVFTVFYAPRKVAGIFNRIVELLAGIPSVVFGFWGLVVLVPIIKHSLLAGIVILALMILPTITLISARALAGVEGKFINGAEALGMSKLAVISKVIIPLAGKGISSAVILATARAIGETIAVLMVTGNIVQLPTSLTEPGRVLTANIALEMAYATDTHHSVLFISGLFLMLVVTGLVIITEKLKGLSTFHEN